ncbi:rhomboid family intramembrane serine protease [Aestuariibacter sp. AA17]|uniref:Rhomboid family intramembrane serine protease n=1 Tax=Fluctibacter corallii TaxID=2984329 RepID=A0ABT3A9N0_9ALTE|nr:rhomboid family intramembrane serine protease [Aestuariibacter sp. AA17]MCV2885390.1 rhomboid family intramembrane serine protease [Aestuariibacter sp. AA17]
MKPIRLFTPILIKVSFVVSILWCIKSVEVLFNVDLGFLGVVPRELTGLVGILTAPLIHGSYSHLFSNTLPLLLLSTGLWYGYPKSRIRVLTVVWLISGIGVWLFARGATHIGASGLTHGLFFFLLVVSMFRRDKRSVVLMMIAFFMYGSMVLTIFPREPHISFEYHFFGALAGIVSACLWHNRDPKMQEKQYRWEQVEEDDPIIGDQWRE